MLTIIICCVLLRGEKVFNWALTLQFPRKSQWNNTASTLLWLHQSQRPNYNLAATPPSLHAFSPFAPLRGWSPTISREWKWVINPPKPKLRQCRLTNHTLWRKWNETEQLHFPISNGPDLNTSSHSRCWLQVPVLSWERREHPRGCRYDSTISIN